MQNQWQNLKTTDFAEIVDKASCFVIIPISGCSDWRLGHPINAESIVTQRLLKSCFDEYEDLIDMLVTPLIDLQIGPCSYNFFNKDPFVAGLYLRELLLSIKQSGFDQIVFYNSNPFNEGFLNATARELRVAEDLKVFCLHMSSIGLDFDLDRSKTRKEVQTVCTYLYEKEPVLSVTDTALSQFVSLANAKIEGPKLLKQASRLLHEILLEAREFALKL